MAKIRNAHTPNFIKIYSRVKAVDDRRQADTRLSKIHLFGPIGPQDRFILKTVDIDCLNRAQF